MFLNAVLFFKMELTCFGLSKLKMAMCLHIYFNLNECLNYCIFICIIHAMWKMVMITMNGFDMKIYWGDAVCDLYNVVWVLIKHWEALDEFVSEWNEKLHLEIYGLLPGYFWILCVFAPVLITIAIWCHLTTVCYFDNFLMITALDFRVETMFS